MEKQDKKDKSAQPPPRKGKVATALRNIHSEQLLKLQMKHQQDADFLEDIRSFTKMRAAVEKEYAQALLKLATTYLQRKCPAVPEMKTECGESYKTVYSVWKTLLDETEKIAKARLAATEVYQQQVSEGAKSLRMYKLQVTKKCFDNLRKMHEEIQQCVVEIDKSKKLYFEEEHMAHDARDKAHDADEKLKRKKGRIFQSISSLQKNSAKFSFRREACDIQATKARNDYVLALVAANAHQMKFYDVDLPDLIKFIDCDIYDKVKEYILLISRTELLTCAACQSAFSIVQEQANMATMQYTMECFFNDNPVLSQPLLYEFEPCDNDKINKLSTEHNAGLCLSKEARRWATCVAKETRVIRDSTEELKKLNAQLGDKPPFTFSEQGPQAEIEQRIDELRQVIRRAQTSKKKAEARLEAMRESGVNVEEWVRTFDIAEPVAAAVEPPADVLSRSGTVTSRASQRSIQSENYDAGTEANETYYDSDNATEPPSSAPVNGIAEPDFVAELASAEDVVAAVQSAWDAAAEPEEVVVVEPEPPAAEPEPQKLDTTAMVNGEVSPVPCYRCVALFSYQATNTDELSFVEQEELDLIGEGDGDGWIRARNCRGEEGYIPQNYVEVLDGQTSNTSPRPPLTSFSSVDYSMPESGEEVVPNGVPVESEAVVSDAKEEVAEPAVVNVGAWAVEAQSQEYFSYCRAVYDYEATCDEELTFFEGQVIKIIRKAVTDVDDGWWEGEVDGKIGLFPSLVVEELKENGEPMTPVDVISPTSCMPPPAFTPPKPQLLILPAQVILTQPTPEIENPYGPPPSKNTVAIAMENQDFHIALTEQQQTHYHQQFSASDSESSEHDVPAPEDETKYAPLVSSPDSPTKSMAASLKETPLEKICEEKGELESSTKSSSECPTVVLTETKFAEFEDEFIYQENVIEGEIMKDAESAYQSTNTFECTFPDATESATEETKPSDEPSLEEKATPSEKPKDTVHKAPPRPPPVVPEQDSRAEQDSDVKMEVGSDVAEDTKAQNDFFEVTG